MSREMEVLVGQLDEQRRHVVGILGDWHVAPDESAADVFALYRDEIRRSNAIITATSLDAAPKQPDPVWATWGRDFPDLRSIVMHVVTETAIHAGHLDVVRELIDGRQWVVL
jgi:hypothetical protein